jgi:hypothetical protein
MVTHAKFADLKTIPCDVTCGQNYHFLRLYVLFYQLWMFRLLINLRPLLFWNVTRRSLVVGYRRFENDLSASPPKAKQSKTPPRIQKFEVLTYIAALLQNKPAKATVSDRTLTLRKFQSHATNSYAAVITYIVTVFLS